MWPVAPEEGAVVGGGGALTDLSGRHPIIIRQRTNYQADTQLSGRHPTVRQTPNCEADTPPPHAQCSSMLAYKWLKEHSKGTRLVTLGALASHGAHHTEQRCYRAR